MRTHLRTPPRRLLLLSAAAAALGLLGGGAAYVLLHLIGLLTNLALFHRLGWTVPSFATFRPGPSLVLAAAAGGLVVALLARWSPEIRGHGIPEAMEAVLAKQSRISPRTALAKPLSAAIAIGTGGPFGAEGPIIVTGGALGSLLGQVLPTSPAERKILLACGAAAGMAATFGSPLAAVVLAIELLLFEFSTRAFVPLVVSAALAAGVHSALFGNGPLFAVPSHDYAGLHKLPLYAVLGLACGLLATVVTTGLFVVERLYRRLPVSELWHPVIGAVAFALVGLVVPRALGVGYDAISDVLVGRLTLAALGALALAKLVAWWVALGSGTSGGTLAPLLLVSGAAGTLFGGLVNWAVPGAHVSPGAFALVAMAATFGAAVRATFTSIVFLFELTRDYQIILPLMLASVIADLVASALLQDSLMTEKLARRGLRVTGDYEVDVLRTTVVKEVMTTDVRTLSTDATVGDARRYMQREGHGAYPVVDTNGQCVGIVAREDLLATDADDSASVAEVASSDVLTVAPNETLLAALERILTEGVEHLPVVDGGRLVGMCTRTDILRARQRQFEHEHLQPGWHWQGRRLRGGVHLQLLNATEPAPHQQSLRRYLVVANRTLGGQHLLDAIKDRIAQGPCEFHLLVPATASSDLYSSVLSAYTGEESGDERAVSDARQRLARELAWLWGQGVKVDGEIGEPDPLAAVERALNQGRYDEVIVSTLPPGLSRWLSMDLPHRLRRRAGVPVTCVSGLPARQLSLVQRPPD